MKALILCLSFLLNVAFADGGVGGFEGGAIVSKKGSILFQDHSMFVNPFVNKTLCLNSNDQYQAYVGKIEVDDRGQVVSSSKGMIFQDKVSTKTVCAFPEIEMSKCPQFKEKVYVQVPNRILLTAPDSSGRQKEFKFNVPRCD